MTLNSQIQEHEHNRTDIRNVVARWLGAALLLAGVLILASMLMPVFLPQPVVIEDTPGDARVRFEVDRAATARDACVLAQWDVEGVQSVTFHLLLDEPQGVIGKDSRSLCLQREVPLILTVYLPDGASHRYTIPVVTSTAKLAPLYILLIISMVLLSVDLVRGGDWLSRLLKNETETSNGWKAHDWVAVFLLVIITLALYIPARFNVYGGDFEPHVIYAYSIRSWGDVNTPHFVFHMLVIALAPLMPGSGIDAYYNAAYVVFLASNVLTSIALYSFVKFFLEAASGIRESLIYGVLVLAILLIMPVNLPTLPVRTLHDGYVLTINLFHNPTTVLLKPLVVLLFLWMIRLMDTETGQRGLYTGLLAVGTAISLFVKPSYTIIVLPPLGLYLLWILLRERRLNWALIMGIFVPALPVLVIQYVLFFTPAGAAPPPETLQGPEFSDSSVIFAPLAVMLSREPSVLLIAIKGLLSVVFPVAFYVSSLRQGKRAFILDFTWAMFIVGALYAYFLAEGGERLTHGNFTWSAQIGLFLLMGVSLMYMVKWGRAGARYPLVWSLFILHLVSGIVWHGVNVASGYGFFWW